MSGRRKQFKRKQIRLQVLRSRSSNSEQKRIEQEVDDSQIGSQNLILYNSFFSALRAIPPFNLTVSADSVRSTNESMNKIVSEVNRNLRNQLDETRKEMLGIVLAKLLKLM